MKRRGQLVFHREELPSDSQPTKHPYLSEQRNAKKCPEQYNSITSAHKDDKQLETTGNIVVLNTRQQGYGGKVKDSLWPKQYMKIFLKLSRNFHPPTSGMSVTQRCVQTHVSKLSTTNVFLFWRHRGEDDPIWCQAACMSCKVFDVVFTDCREAQKPQYTIWDTLQYLSNTG